MKGFIDYLYGRMERNFTRWDYGFLKTYGAIPGLIIGAYFPDFVKGILSVLIVIFGVLLVRYCYLLFFKNDKS